MKAYGVDSITYYKCVTDCDYTTKKEIIDAITDPSNPKCATSCPDGSYIDEISNSSRRVCVKSCRNLHPVAYVNIDTKSCISSCPTDKKLV